MAETPDATEPQPPAPPARPSEADYAERARRADRATQGVLAALLSLEALLTLLVPRAIAFTSGGLGVGRTVALISLAVLLVVAAGTVRRGYGIALGSVLQVALLLTGFWTLAMLALAAIFAAIWIRVLLLRHELVGTPDGWRLFVS